MTDLPLHQRQKLIRELKRIWTINERRYALRGTAALARIGIEPTTIDSQILGRKSNGLPPNVDISPGWGCRMTGEILRITLSHRGQLPVLRFGRRLVVPRIAFERMLTGGKIPGVRRSAP